MEHNEERLLHYVWRHRLFPLAPLRATDGRALEVIDTGQPNTDAGPDFFNAKIRLDGTLWVGNVEIHLRASDWARHGHRGDAAYDNVVLHVVGEADAEVCRTDGQPVPQLQLDCPPGVRHRYDELCRPSSASGLPPCHGSLSALPPLKVHAWLSALGAERLRQKAGDVERRLEQTGGDWEDAFFVTLARNFGFGLNADAFEAWALRLPLRALGRQRDNLFQLEALFLGTAGLLDDVPDEAPDGYPAALRREYGYLRRKLSLADPLPRSRWRFLRLRPDNFPHVRLAQLAWLCHEREHLFSRVLEAASADDVRRLLQVQTSDYWTDHCRFGPPMPRRRARRLGTASADLLLLNTVAPLLYAYGVHRRDEALCRRAAALLDELPAEDNAVVRRWAAAGIVPRSAADSQALLQLTRAYCDRRDCLRCRFGYEHLKGRKEETP